MVWTGPAPNSASLQAFEIPPTRLEFVEELRQGGGMQVSMHRLLMPSGRQHTVVVRTLARARSDDPASLAAFTDEIQLMTTLQHPALVQLVGVCTAAGSVPRAVMEYAAGGPLETAIRHRAVPVALHLRLLLDVAGGMAFLAARGIVHRRLSSRKCLLTAPPRELSNVPRSQPLAKISGFELTRRLDGEEYYRRSQLASGSGSVRWCSPESLLWLRFSEASDMYAFGLLAEQLVLGTPQPYPGLSERDLLARVRSGQPLPRPALPSQVPVCLSQLVGRATHADAASRPRFAEVQAGLADEVLGRDRYELDPAHLSFVSRLGEGAFGVVDQMLLALPQQPPVMVAVKVLKMGGGGLEGGWEEPGMEGSATMATTAAAVSGPAAEAEAEFLHEMQVLMRLRHPNVVALQHVVTRQPPLRIVMELVQGTSLLDWSMDDGPTAAGEDLLFLAHQMALGLAFLHDSLKIVHRDVAARNMLVSERLVLKVSDYGLAREMSDQLYYRVQTSRPLPLRWMAPETLKEQRFSAQSDTWAYAVTLYEMYSFGKLPYGRTSDDDILCSLASGKSTTLQPPPACPKTM